VRAGEHRWILQRQRPGSPRDLTVEVAALQAARAAGVPVPAVIASGDAQLLGQPFMVLEHIEGETIARKILRDEAFGGARQVLVAQMAAALAAIHQVNADAVPGLPDTDQVEHYRSVLDELGEPHPAFELALRWLDDHRPPQQRRTLVHGDFRLGNLMVGPEGLRAVLDWELTHAGDPVEDLGWLCVRAWRFGGTAPVAGVGTYESLLEAYAEASGVVVSRDELRWWEVLGTTKWGIMCVLQTSTHLQGLSRSHELAAIGRRVCENEHDVFLALEGRW
jgi:aminoglycoside phosphotransferase (APT) family kinase protein